MSQIAAARTLVLSSKQEDIDFLPTPLPSPVISSVQERQRRRRVINAGESKA
jgi:hypothetical protein